MPTKAIDEKYLDFHIIGRFNYQGKEWMLTRFEDAVFHGMRIEPGGIDKTQATFHQISDLVTLWISMPNSLTERVNNTEFELKHSSEYTDLEILADKACVLVQQLKDGILKANNLKNG